MRTPNQFRMTCAAIVLALLLVALRPMAADSLPGGQLQMRGTKGQVLGICPLKHTDVKTNITGFVARVTVEQQFANPAKQPIEAVYTFPLPHDAAVDGMTMTIGKRRIVGQIKKREEAKRIYQAAKAAGKKAALLDEERPNIFNQSVANIRPGENVTVTITYVNLLKYDEGSYEWAFPLVVGPRHITGGGGYRVPGQRGDPPPGKKGGPAPGATDAERITPPIAPPGQRAGHDVSLHVQLENAFALREINSPSHAVNVQRSGDKGAVITLQDKSTIPNKDFILRYRVAGDEIQSGVIASAPSEGEGFFTLIVQPPAKPEAQEITPKELVFVVDQTGSQEGWPLAKAKEVMGYSLRRLRPRDTFQVISFNNKVYPCFPKAVSASQANRSKALTFVRALQAQDGTDILQAVQYALKMPADPNRPRIICYLTDGYVDNDIAVINYIRQHRGEARLFPFGIGNAVNRYLIEGMASEGRGVAEYVTVGMTKAEQDALWDRDDPNENKQLAQRIARSEQAQGAAERFFERIENPLLLDVEVDWNGLPVSEIYPREIPDVFSAAPIILKGRYAQPAEGDVIIHGRQGGKPWSQTIHVVLPEKPTGKQDAGAMPSVWARTKLEDLERRQWLGQRLGETDPNAATKFQTDIEDTALRYNLMSRYTSFVAVEEKITNPGGAQQTADTPIELADGLSHNGFFQDSQPEDASNNYAVSSGGGGFSSQAGDPLILIKAPANAAQVIALLPGGEVKKLVLTDGQWQARFDIPTYATDGDYTITVIIVQRNGERRTLALQYKVDSTPPPAKGLAKGLQSDGSRVQLRLQAGPDANRVTALLPWGARLNLKAQNGTIAALADVPAAWRGRAAQVTFIVTDRAHNRTTLTVDLND